jgi:Uma2 family endonuclease
MVQTPTKPLTLAKFLALPEGEPGCELVDGKAVPKVSPKWLHAKSTGSLHLVLHAWSQGPGRIGIEWAVTLQRNQIDWVPIPDLLYISFSRLDPNWNEDTPCPVAPELAVKIISPDQTFGYMAQKAADYLAAGVLRAWVVDPREQSITVFYPDAPPQTFTGARLLTDFELPDLQLTAQQVFQ